MNRLFLLFFALSGILYSLGQTDEIKQGIVISQSDGTTVTLSSIPKRVISLGPNITETIYALGKGDVLIGRTDYCDYPEEVSQVTSVGSLSEPSIEKIIQLQPDLVICSTHAQQSVIDRISSLGIPVLRLYSEESFEGVYQLISHIAKALGANEQGTTLITKMQDRVSNVNKMIEGKIRSKIYYVIGYGEYGDYTAGGNTFIGQMIEMAGAVNAASELKGWRFSLEELIKQDPDIIICSKYGNTKEGLMQAAGYRELRAVKEGHVYTIDNNKLDRQGPRLAEGLEDMALLIYQDEK